MKNKENYTKTETAEHINKLITKLSNKNVDTLFAKKVRKYIRKKMPIGMRAYLQTITLGEVLDFNKKEVTVKEGEENNNKIRSKRIKRLKAEDYDEVISTIIINFRGRDDLTKKDIITLIENKLNIKITQGRWNSLKDKFPYIYKNKEYILTSKGKNKGTKWSISVK